MTLGPDSSRPPRKPRPCGIIAGMSNSIDLRWQPKVSFAFNLRNQPGEISRFTALLSAANINLLAIWGYTDGEDEPRLSLVPDNPDAFRLFAATNGLDCEEGRTLYCTGPDSTGALVDTFMRIADAGINVEAVESMATDGRFGCFLWTDPDDFDALIDLLDEE